MDLLDKTKQLCRLYDIKPARSRGQNFLIREEVYDKIVEQAGLGPDDVVLEVGPGLGFLTAKLAAKVKRVVAVEIDKKLAGALKTALALKKIHPVKSGDAGILPKAKLFDGVKNVEVVNDDIMQFSRNLPPFTKAPEDKQLANFKIVANLPYNITSIFLRKCLESESKPELMVLMLQKEVAERITAKAGQMSLLAVSVQFYAKAEIIKLVPKEFFWPQPEVDSAIVRIVPHQPPSPPLSGGINIEKDFFRLVKFGFSAKRKMLKNNLAAGFRIDQTETGGKIKNAGFNEKIRAQELSVKDWLKLLTAFK